MAVAGSARGPAIVLSVGAVRARERLPRRQRGFGAGGGLRRSTCLRRAAAGSLASGRRVYDADASARIFRGEKSFGDQPEAAQGAEHGARRDARGILESPCRREVLLYRSSGARGGRLYRRSDRSSVGNKSLEGMGAAGGRGRERTVSTAQSSR